MNKEREVKYKLNVSTMGKIMQDVYKTASQSANITWFVENDEFEDGTFTQEDLNKFNKDIETIENYFSKEQVEGIFESSATYNPEYEPVAIIYGAFLGVVSDKDNERSTLTMVLNNQKDLTDEETIELIHNNFEDFFPNICKKRGANEVLNNLSVNSLNIVESLIVERENLQQVKDRLKAFEYDDYDKYINYGSVSQQIHELDDTNEVRWAQGKMNTTEFIQWMLNTEKEPEIKEEYEIEV